MARSRSRSRREAVLVETPAPQDRPLTGIKRNRSSKQIDPRWRGPSRDRILSARVSATRRHETEQREAEQCKGCGFRDRGERCHRVVWGEVGDRGVISDRGRGDWRGGVSWPQVPQVVLRGKTGGRRQSGERYVDEDCVSADAPMESRIVRNTGGGQR